MKARGPGSGPDYATVAYSAATGARLWVQRYNGPGNGNDAASAAAVSPGGATVYVTGTSYGGAATGDDYATVAYSAATGARLWVQRYNGPGNGNDAASAVAVSPGGSRVFVTGAGQGTRSGPDYATVAYSAATGARLWAARYNGPANGNDAAHSVAVSPDGSRVFVTGESRGATTTGYLTVAYSAATGARLWVQRYNGPGHGDDAASAVAVSPGGSRVFVTGASQGTRSGPDYATVAYSAATGARLWVARYNGPANGNDAASAVAVSPGGSRVFVTGASQGTRFGPGLRHGGVQRRDRGAAVGGPLQRPGQRRRRRSFGRGEPQRAHRVRHGVKLPRQHHARVSRRNWHAVVAGPP